MKCVTISYIRPRYLDGSHERFTIGSLNGHLQGFIHLQLILTVDERTSRTDIVYLCMHGSASSAQSAWPNCCDPEVSAFFGPQLHPDKLIDLDRP
jgi:hypothetical protein